MPIHGLRVLVVEDEPAIAESLIFRLATEGFLVDHAATLEQARILLRQDPALVVLDVSLPDGSGFDFCRELRRRSDLPVLFLTARHEEVDRIVGLELGADDYVVKPFSPREVAARIKAILRRTFVVTRPSSPATVTAASVPLQLDPQRHRATYFAQDVALTRAEFRVLEALAERPGVVLSRDRLLDLAWDDPTEPGDRAVDTVVKRVRSALRRIRPGIDPIRTVRGEGYALLDRWDDPVGESG